MFFFVLWFLLFESWGSKVKLITPVSPSGVSRPDLPVGTNSLRPPVCRPTKIQAKMKPSVQQKDDYWQSEFSLQALKNKFVEFPRLCTAPSL